MTSNTSVIKNCLQWTSGKHNRLNAAHFRSWGGGFESWGSAVRTGTKSRNMNHFTGLHLLPCQRVPFLPYTEFWSVVICFSAYCQTEATNQTGLPGANGVSTGSQPRIRLLTKTCHLYLLLLSQPLLLSPTSRPPLGASRRLLLLGWSQ